MAHYLTNLSCLIFGTIEALEIKTSVLFNLAFANNTILSCFFFCFLIIDIYFLISAATEQTFDPIAELVIPIGKERAEIEIQPAIEEVKIRKCSI